MNAHGYQNEMPLPTYDEVVGASNRNVGFKREILVRSRPYNAESQVESELVNAPEGEDRSTSLTPNIWCAQWSKKYLAPIIGIIFAPLLFLFIFLQLKSCGPCRRLNVSDESGLRRLQICNAAVTDISGRYNILFNDLQSVQKERNELLIKQKARDTELKNLRSRYNHSESLHLINLREQIKELNEKIELHEIEYKNLLQQVAPPKSHAADTKTDRFDRNDFLLGRLQRMIDYANSIVYESPQ